MNKIAKINIRKNPSEDFILDICGALKKIKDEETTNLLKLINELEDKNDRK